jgi:EmrB/QacA subfamily drug resistance transporter
MRAVSGGAAGGSAPAVSSMQQVGPVSSRHRGIDSPASPHRRLVLALLVSAQLVVMLDVSIVNVALPSIQADLGTGALGLTWVVNAYVLAFGGLLLLSGRAADVFGRRRLFIAGATVFTAGTLICAASGDAWLLIAGRVVQGAGAAALSPAAMSLLVVTFAGHARAKAMSAWGAASTIGGATGVVAGGVLVDSLGWRANFLVTVPVTLVAALLAWRLLPAGHAPSRPRFDGLGAALLAFATIALVHGVLGAAGGGWSTMPVLASLAASAVAVVVFLAVERRSAEPLVPLDLFRSRELTTGVAAALMGGGARASTFVLAALYLQQALEMAPMRAGLAMAPTSMIGFVVSLAALPRLLRAFGPQRTMVAGLVVLAAGHLWLAHAPEGATYFVAVLPGLALVAIGVALSFTPTAMVITSAVPQRHAGLGSGLAGSATQVGAALGTAGFVSLGAAAGSGSGVLTPAGFSVAFTAAAVVALATAVLGSSLLRPTGRTVRRAGVVLAALLVVVVVPAAVGSSSSHAGAEEAAAPASADTSVDIAAVDRFVAEQIEAASIPGAAVAITKGDQVLHLAGFGHDSTGAPVTADTLFRVASLSKSFTALAVMQLVDQDRLGLDDPVVDHLPEFRIADPRGTDITVRQLLQQTSGLADSTVHPMSRQRPDSLAGAVASLSDARLVAPPGTQWNYSNPNYEVAARLVEVVAGEPFTTYLRDHVFRPAGMSSSVAVDTNEEPVPGLVDGHVVGWGHAFAVGGPSSFDGGEGGVISSAADMADWLVVQTNHGRAADGTRVISDRSLTEQHTAGSVGNGYALGWDTDGPVDAPTRLEHTGNLFTYSGYMGVLPESGYGVVVLLNAGSGLLLDQSGIFYGVRSIVEGTDRTPAGPAGTTINGSTLDAILGLLTVVVLLLGVRGVLRAGRWVRRRREQSWVHSAVRTSPHLVAFGAIVAFPRIAALLVGGREVTWEAAAYGWPALTTWVLSVLAALVATQAARAWHLARRRASREVSVEVVAATARLEGARS